MLQETCKQDRFKTSVSQQLVSYLLNKITTRFYTHFYTSQKIAFYIRDHLRIDRSRERQNYVVTPQTPSPQKN
jgi:hypothetical protein